MTGPERTETEWGTARCPYCGQTVGTFFHPMGDAATQPERSTMTTWLIMASYDDQGTREETLRLDGDLDRTAHVVAAGDTPTADEIAEALDGHDGGEFLLLPLAAGHKITTTVTTTVTVGVDGL